jgi:hypothetical protein
MTKEDPQHLCCGYQIADCFSTISVANLPSLTCVKNNVLRGGVEEARSTAEQMRRESAEQMAVLYEQLQ